MFWKVRLTPRAARSAGRRLGAVDAVDRHRALRRRVDAGDAVDQGALAGAVRPDQRHAFTRVDDQIDIAQRRHPAEPESDAAHVQNRRATTARGRSGIVDDTCSVGRLRHTGRSGRSAPAAAFGVESRT